MSAKKPKPAAVGLDAAFGALSGMSDFLSQDAAASAPATTESGAPMKLSLDAVHPDPKQPRKEFDEAALAELSQSIEAQGVIQPITVRQHPDLPGAWMIVTGERRWRASRQAGLSYVPAVIDNREPGNRLIAQIIENVQRDDLRAMEVARGYGQLASEFGMNATKIAKHTGKSKQVIGDYLAVLEMPDDFRAALESGGVRDVTALVALWRMREKNPQAVTDLLANATPDSPITRAVVRAIGERRDGESTAAVPPPRKDAGVESPSAGEASGDPQGVAGTGDSAGQGGAKSSPGAAHPGSTPATSSLPVTLRVRFEDEDYTVQYDKQRSDQGGQQLVMLEGAGGVTIYAPIDALTLLAIESTTAA